MEVSFDELFKGLAANGPWAFAAAYLLKQVLADKASLVQLNLSLINEFRVTVAKQTEFIERNTAVTERLVKAVEELTESHKREPH